jgi:hypothetical protein
MGNSDRSPGEHEVKVPTERLREMLANKTRLRDMYEVGTFQWDTFNDHVSALSELLELREVQRKAIQLADIASDWNLYEVEIDGVMVGIYDLKHEFEAARSLQSHNTGEA